MELSCAAALARTAWNLELHAPIQTAFKATTAAICYVPFVLFNMQTVFMINSWL
jgi:hypothetical protein